MMESRYYKEHSSYLDRDMEFKMYGYDGILCLIISCQNGRFFEWEDRKMFDLMSKWIDAGQIQFVTIDTIDAETWSSHEASGPRMAQHENWVNYIMNELVPSALKKAKKSLDENMMIMGASMGATHAANLFFRFPDRFSKLIALSGVYDLSRYIYDNNFDGNFYQNSPLAYLPNMDIHHNYIQKYNSNQACFVVGQGAWEDVCLDDLRRLADVMYQKGIQIPSYFWGEDTPHDWPSWEQQILTYLPEIIEE